MPAIGPTNLSSRASGSCGGQVRCPPSAVKRLGAEASSIGTGSPRFVAPALWIEIGCRAVSSVQGSSVITPSLQRGRWCARGDGRAAEAIQAAARSKVTGSPCAGNSGKPRHAPAPRRRRAGWPESRRDSTLNRPAVLRSSKRPDPDRRARRAGPAAPSGRPGKRRGFPSPGDRRDSRRSRSPPGRACLACGRCRPPAPPAGPPGPGDGRRHRRAGGSRQR